MESHYLKKREFLKSHGLYPQPLSGYESITKEYYYNPTTDKVYEVDAGTFAIGEASPYISEELRNHPFNYILFNPRDENGMYYG